MNLKALITTLVLGTSSVALAQPVSFGASAQVTTSFGRVEQGPAIRDHRPAQPIRPVYAPAPLPVAQVQADPCSNLRVGSDDSVYVGEIGTAAGWRSGGWIALTQPTRIERGREFIDMPKNLGRLNTLQLRGAGGDTTIKQVMIEFTNGQTQLVTLNKTLCGTESMNIDLQGRNRSINRIVVYGSSTYGSRYSVLAA